MNATDRKSDGGVNMARVPMGKVLLRNVIRHTDAHNKIQEESEMWKLRGMEKRPPTSHRTMAPASNSSRSHMHCDRVEDGTGYRLGREHSSGQDEREARYWTKKLYDFESNDPDRWGHSGFKELYPEEFKSDGESDSANQNNHRRKKKSKSNSETSKSKHLKKSSKKKKKKKEEKRNKEGESEFSSDSIHWKLKKKRSKSKRKNCERRRGKDEGSYGISDIEAGGRGKRKKQHMESYRDSALGPESNKKRKNWNDREEKSEDSPED